MSLTSKAVVDDAGRCC